MVSKLTIVNGIIQDKFIDGVPVHIQIVSPKGKKNVRTLILMKEFIGVTNHNTGNKNADDGDHAKWMQNVENADKLYVSPHIFVDADSITQVIPLNEVGYHAGDGKGNGNMKTIGLEICEDREIPKAEANAIKLNAAFLITYPKWGIYKHQDWSGKFCPRVILSRNGWGKFVEDIKTLVRASSAVTAPIVNVGKPVVKTYTVKSGDSLSRIAVANKTTVTALVKLNAIKNPSLISIGQIIKLP